MISLILFISIDLLIVSKRFLLLLDCIVKDDDHCLQASIGNAFKAYGYGNSRITCESWKKYCDYSTSKEDMKRCCPVTCQTGPLTEIECDALDNGPNYGLGKRCIYPNEAQCYYKRGFV